MILLSLMLAAAVAAPAQDFAMPEELGAVMLNSRQLAAGAPQAVKLLRANTALAALAPAPINAGFQALGAAGKTGTVKGPGFGTGDGAYRVIQNDPYQMVFDMQTGYVYGRFTLKRDPVTGKDLLGFAGQIKDGPLSGWKPVSGNYAGQILYSVGTDSGKISWQLDGEQITDTFSAGRAGSRSMVITLKGNSHTFTQN